MVGRRMTAVAALVLFAAAVVVAVVEIVRDFPRAVIAMALLVAAALVAWHALLRRGRTQGILLAGCALLLLATIVVG